MRILLIAILLSAGGLVPAPLFLEHMGQAQASIPVVPTVPTLPGATPPGSPATDKVMFLDEDGIPALCSSVDASEGGVFLGKIVPCMVRSIEVSTKKFSAKMVNWLKPLIYTFLILVVCLYGVKVAQAEQDVHKQGFVLLIKIALVFTILENIPTYFVPRAYDVMAESQEIVVGAIDTTANKCNMSDFKGEGDVPTVWALMDCIVGKLFGFTNGTDLFGNKTGNMLLQTSLLGLSTGFLFGGTFGVTVFFALIGVLITMFMLVVRTVLAFINGYIIVCLMLIVCPLFMPLIFLKHTQAYFDGVWKNMLAAFLLPIIISAYTMFGLMMYDKMLFADDAIIKQLFSYTKIYKALEESRKACDRPVTGSIGEARKDVSTEAEKNKMLSNPYMRNLITPTLSAANDPCAMAKIPSFNLDRVDDSKFDDGKDTINHLFMDLLKLLILGFLVQQGLITTMKIAMLITGGASAAMLMNQSMEGEQKLNQSMANARQAAIQQTKKSDGSENTGAQFIQRVAPASGEGMKQFFETMRKK